jgi:hypothetical protein
MLTSVNPLPPTPYLVPTRPFIAIPGKSHGTPSQALINLILQDNSRGIARQMKAGTVETMR